ncbi:DUF1992 domain-containing protein [Polyangium aurulentum]|uniref:DnaJ family domain-containing protein n=1 Tax=Polyangium aurulentum TaxID=2567896 RepID=UPI0010AE8330|nr:DUF1992 domain-containing protein [Polyangium aurulentum]UQA58465.1 DUF1992 domain-containing protein [Polyangium aurulentum]
MRPKDFSVLVEARIQEAAARGAFDDLPGKGKPLPRDTLEGLASEERMAALIHRSAGSAPEEVELIREIAELREALAAAQAPAEKKRIEAELQKKTTRLTILFEASGRNVLVHSPLTEPR